MFTPPRHEPHLHALARQRANQLRREAMDNAWSILARLLRRALPQR
jgi:hypothetical protein